MDAALKGKVGPYTKQKAPNGLGKFWIVYVLFRQIAEDKVCVNLKDVPNYVLIECDK